MAVVAGLLILAALLGVLFVAVRWMSRAAGRSWEAAQGPRTGVVLAGALAAFIMGGALVPEVQEDPSRRSSPTADADRPQVRPSAPVAPATSTRTSTSTKSSPPPAPPADRTPRDAGTTPESQPESSARAAASDRKLETEQKLFLRVDDDLIAADALIDRGLDGEFVADKIETIRSRTLDRSAKAAIKGAELDVNDITGALSEASAAARASDLPGLVAARRDLVAARLAFSSAALGR